MGKSWRGNCAKTESRKTDDRPRARDLNWAGVWAKGRVQLRLREPCKRHRWKLLLPRLSLSWEGRGRSCSSQDRWRRKRPTRASSPRATLASWLRQLRPGLDNRVRGSALPLPLPLQGDRGSTGSPPRASCPHLFSEGHISGPAGELQTAQDKPHLIDQ